MIAIESGCEENRILRGQNLEAKKKERKKRI